MTNPSNPAEPARRQLLLGLAGALVLPACGGDNNDEGDQARLRALNLTTDLPSLDLYTGDTRRFGALATDALASYLGLDGDTYTLKLKRAGDSATLLSGSYQLSKDKHYTAVIWGRENALRLSTLPEDEDNSDIDSGNTRLRIFNATVDTGAVDIFVTASNIDIGEAQATQASVPSGGLSSYRDLSRGTYRLRITGAGDPGDLRLDVAEITLDDQKHTTLMITPGASGVLVNAHLLVQQAGTTVMKNTKARVRLVASADGGANVAASLAGRTLAGGLRSPSVGPYQLVDAATAELTVRVNGNAVLSEPRSFVAGTDYTLLAFGKPDAAQVLVLVDDNRLPSSSSRVKIRLLHGIAAGEALTLSVDYLALATDLSAGSVSAYTSTASSSSARLDVTSASAAAPLFTNEEVNLQGSGVYTVFMLSGNATPTGIIRKER